VTLILSSSDYAFYNNGALDNTLTGTAVLHSSINSAVNGYDSGSLSSSSYCRGYLTADIPTPQDITFATVSSSVAGGAYSGSWGDNAISIRAWVNKGSLSKLWIMLKSYSTDQGQSSKPRGYSLWWTQGEPCRLYAATNPDFGGQNKAGAAVNLAVDKWHRIRLDYVPRGTAYDFLSFYTASAGGTDTETWELVDTMTILNSDNWYVTASIPSAVGYAFTLYEDNHPCYIDDFQVYVTPVG